MASAPSPIGTAINALTKLEDSLNGLRKTVELKKVELTRLAQEAGEESYRSVVAEAQEERDELVASVQKVAEAEAAAIVEQGRGKVTAFEAKAAKSRKEIQEFIVSIMLNEA